MNTVFVQDVFSLLSGRVHYNTMKSVMVICQDNSRMKKPADFALQKYRLNRINYAGK